MAPARLGRFADETVLRRLLIQDDGAEGGDANCAQGAVGAAVFAEKVANRRQRGDRIGRGETPLCMESAAFITDGAHKFCAAGLNGTEQS